MSIWIHIWNFLKEVPPVFIIWQNEAGVLMRFGKFKKEVQPGIYLRFPFLDKVMKVVIKEQIVNLSNQTMMTRDGESLGLSCTVRYEIVDVRKALLEVYDFDSSIQNYTMGALGSYIARTPDRVSYGDVVRTITEELQSEASDWGIEIIEFRLTDMAPAFVIRLLSD